MCSTHILYVIFMYVQHYKQQQYNTTYIYCTAKQYMYVLHSPVRLYTKYSISARLILALMQCRYMYKSAVT